ncbi:hypothetical protein LK996_11340 [Lysobacter sp. A6]|uniref:Uncharacterized protein n=1 Tax=Noviluteimonas lactosilytica TaxID=2888523 RepID=A0ABS8JJ80_9GAMM|nr:hypothetical protein [Lysobacter lactosilyticus]MCC8363663.1 hypothetical protein [Lysobacter lactosilyticus]
MHRWWLLASLAFSLVAFAGDEPAHTAPLDVRNFLVKQGCDEVVDFYSEQDVVGQPYVYGIGSLIDEGPLMRDFTFVAWCVRDHDYQVVADLGGRAWPGGCRFPIRGFDFAGSLTITDSGRGILIRSERDGLVVTIRCDAGQWVRQASD